MIKMNLTWVAVVFAMLLATRQALAEDVWFSSLDLSKITQGWGAPQKDLSVSKQPLAIGGQQFKKGVGTHAPMNVYIRPNGAQRFRAQVGIDDNSGSTNEGSVVFQVIGDGRLLFTTPVMKPGDKSSPVDVALKGIRLLQLVVTDASDGFSFDHADWANAYFETSDGKSPETFSPMNFGSATLAPAGQGIQMARTVVLPFERVLPESITNYVLVTADGDFHQEYLIKSQPLNEKGFLFEQKAGRSGVGLKPWFMLRSMTTGKGVSAMLAYSGNWKLAVKPEGGKTMLLLDSVPSGLKPFKTVGGLPLPGAIVADFSGEWDNGALPITRFIRNHLAFKYPAKWPLVEWNNWYDDLGYPTEQSVLDGAKASAAMGCELVTLDAGWYGGNGSWEKQCGNWTPNKKRFPNGLKPLIKKVRKLGMKFGLWIEIESASPDSLVVKEHPDWLLRDGGQLASGRSVLDFGKPEVVAWAKSVIDRLMQNYHLDYLKDDFNTDLIVDSEASKYASGDPLYFHYKGVNEFWSYVHKTYPNLIIENCSGGSGRQDAMTASQSTTHWVSDEVGNNYNLGAVFGATYLFPPETCLHWFCYPDNHNPSLDIKAQITANMMGDLGFSGHISQWDKATQKIVAHQIARYKQIRAVISNADVYHLTPQANPTQPHSIEAALYVAPKSDRAILFAFQGGADSLQCRLALRGFSPKQKYRFKLSKEVGGGGEQVVSGQELMEHGIDLLFSHKGASTIVILSRI